MGQHHQPTQAAEFVAAYLRVRPEEVSTEVCEESSHMLPPWCVQLPKYTLEPAAPINHKVSLSDLQAHLAVGY